jgi:hypothetical protein
VARPRLSSTSRWFNERANGPAEKLSIDALPC